MIINMVGGSGSKEYQIIVEVDSGSTVTATKNGVTVSAIYRKGFYYFSGLDAGTWTVMAIKGNEASNESVNVVANNDTILVKLVYDTIPKFTYTGQYEIVNDDDKIITNSKDNWKIRFLTSGTLTFTELIGAVDGIDVFLVGGGGGTYYSANGIGGGGGGYTTTAKGISVDVNTDYPIVIGGGGTGASGGQTTAFNFTANGGNTNSTAHGGSGGSGGGGYAHREAVGTNFGFGGSDGSNGYGAIPGVSSFGGAYGYGQGTTTREFAEVGRRLYAGGGGGLSNAGQLSYGGNGGGGYAGTITGTSENGDINTGGGAGGEMYVSKTGGSGIVVIRNTRDVAPPVIDLGYAYYSNSGREETVSFETRGFIRTSNQPVIWCMSKLVSDKTYYSYCMLAANQEALSGYGTGDNNGAYGDKIVYQCTTPNGNTVYFTTMVGMLTKNNNNSNYLLTIGNMKKRFYISDCDNYVMSVDTTSASSSALLQFADQRLF